MAASPRDPELEYLRAIEALAHEVVEEAAVEDWLAFGEEGQQATLPLHRAINRLATRLRMTHYDGDGCLHHLDVEQAQTR